MYFEYQYRITYESGQFYDRPHQLSIPISKDEYKTIMQGVVNGLSVNQIEGISDVISKMTEQVQYIDSWINMNGSQRSTQLKKPRAISELEFFLPPTEYQRIKKMKDPMAVFERSEEHMTLYRNDGSNVNLSSENGKVTIRDSKNKNSHTIMDVELFLSYVIH